VARLVIEVLRLFSPVLRLGFYLLTFLWLAAPISRGAAPDGPDTQRAEYLTTLGKTMLGMFLPLLAGQAIAFGVLNSRVVQMLPVSRRDIWRAKWVMATLGAATLTTAARALAILIARAIGWAPSVAFTQLVVTWVSTFILGGVLLATVIWAPRLPCEPRLVATTGVIRNLLTLVVWVLRNLLTSGVWLLLAVFLIMGAIRLPGLLLRYLTMDWHGLTGWHGMATALALLVAIASYWHRPRVHTRAGRPRETGSVWRGTVIPRGTLSAIRLLVFENVVSVCLSAAVLLGVIMAVMTVLQPFSEVVARIASKFSSGGVTLFVFTGLASTTFNGRHLRTLPISTLRLTGLLLLPAPVFWLAGSTLISCVHLAVLGTLPRIDPSVLALVMGVSAVSRPLYLQVRHPKGWLFLLALFPLSYLYLIQPLPVLEPLTYRLTLGVLLTAIAIAWSYWLLTRSAMPFSASMGEL
jgi:hypothetical protein